MKLSSSFFHVRFGSLAAALAGLLATHTAQAADITWNGPSNGETWNTTIANWNTLTANPWNSDNGSSNIAVFNTSSLTLNVDSVYANGITFTQSATLSGGNITLSGLTPTITGTGTIGSALLGTAGFTKSGTGTLTLTGTNLYTGGTRITGGTVAITSDANLGEVPGTATLSSLVLDNGILSTSGTFTLNANRGIAVGRTSGSGNDGTINVSSGELTYNGIIASNGGASTGGLVKSGAGTLTLGGVNTYAGNTDISAGTLKIANTAALPSGTGKGDVTIAGTLDLNANSITLNGLSGAGSITSSAAGSISLTAGANNRTSTFNGMIANGSGTIALTKTGTGTLTLGGSNTFTGGVTINGGALQLANAGALNSSTPNTVTFGPSAAVGTKLQLNGYSVTIGALATNATPGTVIIENANALAATLTVNQATNTTFAGVLQNGTGAGTLGLTKSGAGTLTLTGNNTFTGTATISAGTLALSGGAAIADGAAVSLANTAGAILLLNANETIGSLAGGGTTGGNVNLQSFTLTTGGATNYAGAISGTGSLIKTGSGVFTLSGTNTSTGTTTVSAGTLALSGGNAIADTATVSLANTTGAILQLNASEIIGALTGGGATGGNLNLQTFTLTTGGTNSDSTYGGAISGTGSLVKTGTGKLTLSGVNTYTGATTINGGGSLSVGDINNALGSTSSIALSNGTLSYTGNNATFTRGYTVSSGGGQIDTTTAGQTLTLSGGNVAITSTGNFTVGGAGNTLITSNITGASGGILNKTGLGTLTLSGANTYTGATNIRNGSLVLGVDNGVNQTATLTLGDGTANTNGVLRLNGFSQTLSGLSTTGAGTGNRVTGGNATLSNLTINNSGASSFAGILGGTGTNDNNLALIKTGAGVLTLTGTSTYTGGTTISAGTIAVGAATNLGASGGSLSIGNATLQITNDLTSARNIGLTNASSAISVDSAKTYTNSGAITGNGALNLTGSGTLLLSGTLNTFSGGTNIRNGTLTIGVTNSLPTDTLVTLGNGTVSGRLALNGFSQTVAGLATSGTGTTNRIVNGKSTSATLTVNNASDTTFGGILGGSTANENNLALTKTGAGKLTITGTNTYTGNTRISGGILAVQGGSALLDSNAVVLDDTAGAALQLNTNETIGSLTGGGTTGGNVNLQSFTLTTGGDNSSTNFGGAISGTGALTKAGTGTMTLSGTNTYSGTTTVNAGTLALSGGAAILDTGAVSLANTAGAILLLNANETIGSLAGGGTNGGNVNLQSFTLTAGGNNAPTTYTGIISGTGGGLIKMGTGTLTLAGSSTYTGATIVKNGTLALSVGNDRLPTGTILTLGDSATNDSGVLSLNGRSQSVSGILTAGSGIGNRVVNGSGTAVTFTVNNTSGTNDFSGILGGSGTNENNFTLAKSGAGTLLLSGNNTFTGNVIINTTGVLRVGNVGALNASGVNTVTFGSGATNASKLQLNGNNITIAGLATNATTAGSPIVENANSINAILTINNTGNFTYASAINDGTGSGGNGTLALVKLGSGTQTLNSTISNYSGGTTISGGILSVNSATSLGATSGNLSIGNGTLQVTANIAASSRNIGITHANSTILVNSGVTYTSNGVISGAGTLNKDGVGIFQITGNQTNTYNGGTIVKAGLLDIVSTTGTPLGEDVNTNNIIVSAGGNLSLSSTANKGANQTITVNSTSGALGGIGFSSTGLTLDALTPMFINNTGDFGGVLGINTTSYNAIINLSTLGSGNWFLGSASSGTYSGTNATLTAGANSTYRLGGGGGALTFSASNVLTGANNVLVGSSSINGNGMVTISTAQDYTGNTTVTGTAVLAVGNNDRLGNGTGVGNIVLDNGTLRALNTFTLNSTRGIALGSATGSATGTIDTNNSGTILTYNGTIADNGTGADSLTKIGAGTLILGSGSINTFTGATNISAGTLNFSRTENLGVGGPINFGQGTTAGTLQYASGFANPTDITTRTVTTTGTGGAIIDTNGNDVTFGNSAISGSGSFTKSGTGTLTLNVANTYTGATTITAGTVKLGNVAAIPSATAASTTTITGTLDLNGLSPTVNLLRGAGTITNTNATAAAISVNTGGSSTAGTFSGAINDGNGTVAFIKTGANTLNLTGTTSTYSGGTTISAGTLSISNDRALGSGPVTETPGNITITGGATLSASANMILDANRGIAIGPSGSGTATLAPATGTTLTYNGIIANSGTATGGLTKSNTTGILVLGGANTYAGDTAISGGTLKITKPLAIPFGAGKGNVSIASTNSGNLDLNGNAINVNGLTGAGTVTNTATGQASSITVGNNNATSGFTGVISNGSGTVSLGKTGTGTLTLSGNSTYTGGTTITGGTINISRETALGASSGNLTFNGSGATLQLAATISPSTRNMVLTTDGTIDTNGFTLATSGTISGVGGLSKIGAGTLSLSGVNTYSGNTTVSVGTLQLANVAAIPSGSGKGNLSLASGTTLDLNNLSPTVNGLTGAGTVTNSQTGAVTFTAGSNDATSTFSGIIQNGNGTVAFTKTGTGILTLSGTNTFTGTTTVSAGTLALAGGTVIPDTGAVVLADTAGAVLQLNAAETIGSLAGGGLSGGNVSLQGFTLTTGAANSDSIFNGAISGTGGLTKDGTGKLTLGGTNTYSGPTTISTGTLALGSDKGLSSNSTLTIFGPGFLDINGYSVAMDGLLGTGTILNNGLIDATLTAGAGGGSTSFGGVIADGTKAISLTKSGSGTLTLTGINTYSGDTTIANGTLSVANIGAGGNLGTGTNPIILGDVATKGILSYTGTSDLTYTRGFTVNAGGGEINTTAAGKTLTLQGTDITTAGTFTVSGDGNALVQSVITGSGGLTKANTGSMILSSVNTYTGDTTISTGTLQVTNAAAIPSGTGKGNVAVNGTSILDVNNLSLTLNGLSGSGVVTNTAGSPVSLTVGGNDATANFTGIIQDGSGVTSLVKTGTGIQTLGGANTYSGDTTISAGTLQFGIATAIPSGSSKGNVVLGASGTLDLNDFEVSINGLSGSGLITNNAGASTLSVGNNNQSSEFTGTIKDGLGTIGLTKTGTGMLTLSGTSTFSGATTISQGTLSMGSDTGLSSSSTLMIGDAGALDLNGKVIAIDGLAGTGSITNNSATQVTLTIGSSGGSGTFGGTINDGTGVIGLVKTGSGTVTLSNLNTYSGHTTVTGGLLAITSYGALGQIPATVDPANIVLNGGGISAANTFVIDSKRGIAVGPASSSGFGVLDAAENQTLTYNGIIANNESGTGGLKKAGLGTLTLGGVNTYSGDTTVSTGALQIGNTLAIPSGSGKGDLVLNATLDLNNTSITVNGLFGTGTVTNTKSVPATLSVGDNGQTSTFAGILENGNGLTSLTKVGTGTLTLAGTSSTYTGTTTVAAGTLSISQDANLGGSNDLVINAGATLAATSTFTLATNRGIAVGPSGAGIIDVASSKTLTYGGAIANNGGSGGFTKTGTGTLILTGNSTYTGTTTVEAGVMTVNGNIGGSEATVVKTGATLNGTGTTGAMDIESNGTLQPGDGGIGTLTVTGHLSLAGIANFELGAPGASHASTGTSDRVDVTGDVVYGGTINLIDNNNASGFGSAGAGSYKLITYTGTSSGTFAGVTGLPKYHNAFHDVPADNALYIDLYDYAVATVTQDVDLGRIHAGGTFGTQTLRVGNSAASGDFTETLGGVIGSTSTGITASGSVTGIAGQTSNSSNIIVGISDNTAGLKSGSVGVDFTSQAVSGSGLANTGLISQNVTVTGFAYSGQSVWNIAGDGSWGNNVNAFDNWTHAGGVAGLDGILSINDTATFGNATTAPSTVSLDGANPTLSGIRFDHDQSYTLAQGTGGSLTLKGNGAPALVANDNGSHTISTSLGLASNANVSVANSNDKLTISGTISGLGNGITKSGDGTLALTGHSGYTGATVVSAGTLLVNGSLGNTSATIASGATLAGNGTLGGSVMVNGNIAPGEVNDIGTIGVGSLFVDHLMSIDWNGNTDTVDRINITNALQLGELSTIVFTGIDGVLTREAYVFAAYGTFTGPITRFGTVVDMPSGYTIDYAYGAGRNQLALVVVPEQGSVLLGGLGVLILLRRRRANRCSS